MEKLTNVKYTIIKKQEGDITELGMGIEMQPTEKIYLITQTEITVLSRIKTYKTKV